MSALSPARGTSALYMPFFLWSLNILEEVNAIFMKWHPLYAFRFHQGGENTVEYGFSKLLSISYRQISYFSRTAQWNPLLWYPQELGHAHPVFSSGQVKRNKDWEGCVEVMVVSYRKWTGFWHSADIVIFSGMQPHAESVGWMWEISSVSSQTCQVVYGKQ